MTALKTKLYQMFILGTDGNGYQTALEKGLGGIIFFTKDIQTPEQFKLLIKKIKSMAKIPPFLSIDQEGGRVERTENIHNGKKYLSAKFAFRKGEDFLKKQTSNFIIKKRENSFSYKFYICTALTLISSLILGKSGLSL